MYGLRKPKSIVRGTDVAGVVEAVGSAVTTFRPGDEVFGGYFANSRPKKSSMRSYDTATAARLRQVSARLVGLT